MSSQRKESILVKLGSAANYIHHQKDQQPSLNPTKMGLTGRNHHRVAGSTFNFDSGRQGIVQ